MTNDIDQKIELSDIEKRQYATGEGWLICFECGGKVGSFDLPFDAMEKLLPTQKGVTCPMPTRCKND